MYFSTAFDACSQCSPVPIRSCTYSSNRNPSFSQTTRFLYVVSGHSLKQERKDSFLGYSFGSVLCILDICVHVHPYISSFTLHSRCSMEPCVPHCVQFYVSITRIEYNLTFVGIFWWIAMYHADQAPSGNITLWRRPWLRVSGWQKLHAAIIPWFRLRSRNSSWGVVQLSFKNPPIFGLPLGFHVYPFVKINA